MVSPNLSAVLRIKSMARAAATSADANTPDVGRELAAAYERLRLEAKGLADRAGWNDDESFDRELPPLGAAPALRQLPRGMVGQQGMVDALAAGQRARVMLGQLAAWAEGHQEAFELEERFRVDAEAKLKAAHEKAQATAKGAVGFGAA